MAAAACGVRAVASCGYGPWQAVRDYFTMTGYVGTLKPNMRSSFRFKYRGPKNTNVMLRYVSDISDTMGM